MSRCKKLIEKYTESESKKIDEDQAIVDRVDSLVNALSKEISNVKKNLDNTNPAIFLRNNTSKKKVYDAILSDMEKEISKRVKVWKKLIK